MHERQEVDLFVQRNSINETVPAHDQLAESLILSLRNDPSASREMYE